MEHAYTFHPSLVLRTPARPLADAAAPTQAAGWLADAAFREALYLTSPPLLAEAERWQRGELRDPKKEIRLLAALGRYHSRMRSRCTPFGLFAGCAVIGWGSASNLVLDPAATTRHTRLDMHYLCALAARLAAQEPLRNHLRYAPNSSLYDLGAELRYVEYSYGEGRPPEGEHQLSAVEATDALRQVLAAASAGGGQPRHALAHALLGAEVAPSPDTTAAPADAEELAQALAFVDELIGAQLLVSELEPTVTGVEFLPHLRQALALLDDPAAPHPDLTAVRTALADVSTRLAALDAPGQPANQAAAYADIEAVLAPLGVPIEPGKLFHVDLLPGVRADSTLAASQQAALLAALQVLGHLTAPSAEARLAAFKAQFGVRYEERTVPLLEALDSESGIPYSDYGRHAYAPLIEDLVVPESAETGAGPPPLTRAQQYLATRLRAAKQAGAYAISLTLAEVQHLPSVVDDLPLSFSVMFRALADEQLYLESAGGASAANLLGRFAHASPAIAEVVRSVAASEQAHSPGVVLAEICHLPASRLGNILLRPCFRDFELPYLARAACPPAGRLALQDLTLRLRRGQLELHCSRTGHQVLPRLSSAHNYSQQALPVYQLLCDLQTQGRQTSLGLSWDTVAPDARFRPRLTHQSVILLAASWQLAAADLADLLTAPPGALAAAWVSFRQRWQLPRYFTLADADNELLVDGDDPASVQDWLLLVRARPRVLLKEFLFDPATCLVRDPAGRPYTNQLVASLLRTTPCYLAPAPACAGVSPTAVPRSFALGSEWLYYKLYCGPKVADRLLTEVLAPLLEELLAQGWVDEWFFIRYTDPDPHLRLRLHLPALATLGSVVQAVATALAPHTASGSLWKIQTDTYQRELERYGSHTIELAESLFYYDSRRLLARLAWPHLAPTAPTGWLGAARGIDELLAAFGCDLPRRLALLTQWRTAFAREFAVDKPLRIQLDSRYRQHRAALHAALTPPNPAWPDALPLAGLLPEVARQVLARHAQGQLDVNLDALLGSYVHMLVNRAVSSQPRLHELLVYDFLARYYQSEMKR